MDKSSLIGIFLAVGGILAGLLIEGGNLRQIVQPTAAMIVLGGTLGAVMLQVSPSPSFSSRRCGVSVRSSLLRKKNPQDTIRRLVDFAQKARRSGVVSLDAELPEIEEPFLKRSLMLAVDGTEPEELRKIMELELDNQAEYEEQVPQVFESAGGFAPTIGIIGAVLGLIQVMQHLDKIDEVGRGIAVAFVATIYGVGSANLLYLPVAGEDEAPYPRRADQPRDDTRRRGLDPRRHEPPHARKPKLLGFLVESSEARSKLPRGRYASGHAMRRRKRNPPHSNHERWLVSYADFITLLFAFFVVLYASEQVDQRKVGRLALAIQVAFQELGVFPASTTQVPLNMSEPMPFQGTRRRGHSRVRSAIPIWDASPHRPTILLAPLRRRRISQRCRPNSSRPYRKKLPCTLLPYTARPRGSSLVCASSAFSTVDPQP